MSIDLNDFKHKNGKGGKKYLIYRLNCDCCGVCRGYGTKLQSHNLCKNCYYKKRKIIRLPIAKEKAISQDGECLSNEYIDPFSNLIWKCSKNHVWYANYNNVVNNNTWCPKCADTAYTTRFSLKSAQDLATKHNGLCLSTQYLSARKPLIWQCQYGHIFANAPCNVKAGSWCPKCLNKTEQSVREIFESIFNKKFPRIRPNFLKNPVTGFNLELDGYCEELKIAFEYDGEWHFQKHFADDNLDQRKNRDTLKDELCKQHGILLYRVPYTQKTNLISYINDLVKSNKHE